MDAEKIESWAFPPTDSEQVNYKSTLDLTLELDHVIQCTPMNERATSPECIAAYQQLKFMSRPRFHICRTCGGQYGNQETRIKEDESNLYGICPWCEKGIVNGRLQAQASVD